MYDEKTVFVYLTRHVLKRAMTRLELPYDIGLVHAHLRSRLKRGYLSKHGADYILDITKPPVRIVLVDASEGRFNAKTLFDREGENQFTPYNGTPVRIEWYTEDHEIVMREHRHHHATRQRRGKKYLRELPDVF